MDKDTVGGPNDLGGSITAGTPTVGSGSPTRRLEAPSLPAWLPASPPWCPAPWIRVKGLQAVPLP
jgi:hypothetical protein